MTGNSVSSSEDDHLWFPPIYKFMNKRFVKNFLNKGIVRIGTSSEYRIPDGHDAGRSDENEMLFRWNPPPGPMVLDPTHAFIRHLTRGEVSPDRRPANVHFAEGVTFAVSADTYVFSASMRHDAAIADQMKSKFDADACVRIDDPRAFMLRISQHPQFCGKPHQHGPVRYTSSNESQEFYGVDAFEKLDTFAWQQEFRMVWSSRPLPISGTIIEVPEITDLLERVS